MPVCDNEMERELSGGDWIYVVKDHHWDSEESYHDKDPWCFIPLEIGKKHREAKAYFDTHRVSLDKDIGQMAQEEWPDMYENGMAEGWMLGSHLEIEVLK